MLTKTTRQRFIGALAATAALALALTGCQSAVDAARSSGPVGDPVQGGTMEIAQVADASPSTPLTGAIGNASWTANVFETLTYSVAGGDGSPQPLLATKWTLADDAMSIDLTLREGVTFHTGRAFTADDVAYTVEYAQDPSSGADLSFLARNIASVDVVSPTEVTLTFTRPTPNIFDLLNGLYILDKDTAAGLADGTQVVGTGPFTFEDWTPGSGFSLKPYEGYWGDKPYLDGVQVSVINDSTAMMNAMRSGRTQYGIGMGALDAQALLQQPGFVRSNAGIFIYPLGMNVTVAPFDDKRVRQAVAYAIDRERIVDQVFPDTGTVNDLHWPTTVADFPTEVSKTYAHDVDKAKQLLSDAGVAPGTPVEITVISNPVNRSIAEIVRNNLEEVGFAATVNALEAQVFQERNRAGDLGAMFITGGGTGGLQPVSLLDSRRELRKDNLSKFWTDEYEALRKELVSTANTDGYGNALDALSTYITDEAFSTNISQIQQGGAASDKAQGVELNSSAALRLGRAWLAQ